MSQSLERIKIEGFAGIDDLDLEVRPFTVLIGPQSVGKSIVAKLLFFFRSAPRNLYLEALKDTGTPAGQALLEIFTELLPLPTHSKGAAKITYSTGHLRFVLEGSADGATSWKISLPRELTQPFRKLVSDLQEEDGEEGSLEANELAKEAYNERVEKAWPASSVRPRFVPAGRAFFSQIERDVASYLESAPLDPFVAEFWKFLAVIKGRQRVIKLLPTAEAAKSLCFDLLSGSYERRGNEEYIQSVDGRKLPPRLWSSGQQEAQPVALLLQRYCEGFFAPAFLFIEEPEAHLFPFSQRLVTELIALAYNARQPEMQIFITTHSPYILTTINNLLLAGQLYQREPGAKLKAALSEVVPADRGLLPENVGAYYMDRANCRSIMDVESGLIGTSAIDEVSGALNEQFDALLEIDRA